MIRRLQSWLMFLGLGTTLCGRAAESDPVAAHNGEVVVLLHGWWAPSMEMLAIQWRLTRLGYRVLNVGYPSVRVPLEDLAARELPKRLRVRVPPEAPRVHFVTHSMGGVLVRRYLELNPPPNLGRVVMIGPPNHGSELADRWLRVPGARFLAGPNLANLSTHSSFARSASTNVPYELGIIAGISAPFAWNSPLSRPHDGKVSLASTGLAGMRAQATVRSSHSLLPWHPRVLGHVASFLERGEFAVEGRGD